MEHDANRYLTEMQYHGWKVGKHALVPMARPVRYVPPRDWMRNAAVFAIVCIVSVLVARGVVL